MISDVKFTIMGNIPINSKTLVKDIQDLGRNRSVVGILKVKEDVHAFIMLDFVKKDITSYLEDRVVDHIQDIQFYRFIKGGSDVSLYSISTSNCFPDLFKPGYSSLEELLDDINSTWGTLDNFLDECTCSSYHHDCYEWRDKVSYYPNQKLKEYQKLVPGYLLVRDFIHRVYKKVLDRKFKTKDCEKKIVLVADDKDKLYTLSIYSDLYKLSLCKYKKDDSWYIILGHLRLFLNPQKAKKLVSLIDDLFFNLNKYYDISTSAMFKLYADEESINYNNSHSTSIPDTLCFPGIYSDLLSPDCLYVSGAVKTYITSGSKSTYVVTRYIENIKSKEQQEAKQKLKALKEVMASKEYATVYVEGNNVIYQGKNPDILKFLTLGEKYKTYTYYIVDNGFFYLQENPTGVHLNIGIIQDLGKGACLCRTLYTSYHNEGNSYGDFELNEFRKELNQKRGLNFICDSKEELKKQISTLKGKSARANELGNLQKASLIYRYCTLVDLRDTPFGLLMYFEDSSVYLSKVSLKLYVNRTKTTTKDAIENAKKAVKLPVVKQYIKKVNYTYSVYEVSKQGTKLSSNSSYARKFIKKYPDILDVLKLSKDYKDLWLRVRVYDPNNKEFDRDCVVSNGEITEV